MNALLVAAEHAYAADDLGLAREYDQRVLLSKGSSLSRIATHGMSVAELERLAACASSSTVGPA